MVRHRLAVLFALLLLVAAVPAAKAQPAAPTKEILWVQLAIPKVEIGPDTMASPMADSIMDSLSRQRDVAQGLLEELKAQGLVSSFELMATQPMLTFTGNREAVERLRERDLVEASGLGAPDAETVAAAANQLEASIASQMRLPEEARALAPDAITNVTVGMPYGYVWGYTPGQDRVRVTLLSSSGAVKGTIVEKTWPTSDRYFDTNIYNGCTTVMPQPGDRVQVQTVAQSVTVDVVNLTVRVDERTNVVSGTGPANSQIALNLYHSLGCTSNSYQATVTTNAAGQFSRNFSSQVDILRGDYAYATWRNSAGHGAQVYAYAPYLRMNQAYRNLYGRVRAAGAVTVELRSSSGALKETKTTTAGSDANFYVYFSTAMVAGDQVVVTSGGETWRMTVSNLSTELNPSVNRVRGQGPANTAMRLYFSGLVDYGCMMPTTNASGVFNVAVRNYSGNLIDVMGGDWVSLYLYDAQRNYQYAYDGADSLQAYVATSSFSGYTGPDRNYTATLRNASGTVKATRTSRSSAADGWYSNSFSATIVPGDRLSLTVGQNTRTITVPVLSAAYTAQRTLVGTAPPSSRVWIEARHPLSLNSYGLDTLYTGSGPHGAYSASLADTWWGGAVSEGDTATAMSFDANDNAGIVEARYGTPQVVWQTVPAHIVPNANNTVRWQVRGGSHAEDTYLLWDTVSHSDPYGYAHQTACKVGLAGTFDGQFIGPTGASTVYMRARANVVGASSWTFVTTNERAVPVGGSEALTETLTMTPTETLPLTDTLAP